MAKTKIILNDKEYLIDESVLSSASNELKEHLSTVMNGSGAVINLDRVSYNIDSTKLSAATTGFIAHLGTIAGTGLKVVIGGVEYGIDSSKVAGTVESFEDYLVEAGKPKPSEGLSFVSNNDGTCYVTNGTCTDTEIVITAISPAGDRVTGIPSEGFWGYRDDIVSVVIPNTVVEIGSYAFWECYDLTTITYEGTIEQWQAINKASDWDGNGDTGDYTIYCTNGEIAKDGTVTYYKSESNGLEFRSNGDGTCYVSGIGTCTDTDIVIPDEYDGKPVTSIGSGAFWDCTGLTSIVIPDSVTSIGDNAFYGCGGLESAAIGKWVTSIGDSAFGECYELINVHYNGTVAQWLAIPKDNDYMAGSAWDYDTGEYTVYCTDGEITKRGAVTYYPSTASEGLAYYWDDHEGYACYVDGIGTCTDTDIIIPKEYSGWTVVGIDYNAFKDNKNLTSIVIPDSVTRIRNDAFNGCSSLTSIVIPDSVTNIGNYAFYNCTGLKSIVVGKNVTTIGSYAFYNCTGLTSIFYTGTTKQWEEIDGTYQLAGVTVCCSDGYIRID